MSWEQTRNLLQAIFQQINVNNDVPLPSDLWTAFGAQINPLVGSPVIEANFAQLDDQIWSPQPVEVARLLSRLRQRRRAQDDGRPLVGRLRAEAILRQRPPYDVLTFGLAGNLREIADIGQRDAYSHFQVEGWERIIEALRDRTGLVIVAPTGGGKTEVFLLPIVWEIARSLSQGRSGKQIPCFILLYPRVALLKDQLARIFKYVHWAEQQILCGQMDMFQDSSHLDQGIVIGFQFSGIRSTKRYTLQDQEIFEAGRYFRIVDQCPICADRGEVGRLEVSSERRQQGITVLRCDNDRCGARFLVSMSKKDHITSRPHIMVTTAESLDRLYLTPGFENYLRSLTGIIFDEVHLYHSLYGVHISNLLRSIENLRGSPLAKIAASATVSNPERFAAKLFYGDEAQPVTVHEPAGRGMKSAGLEVVYFVQSPEGDRVPGSASTLIQTVMAVGHGLLNEDRRGIVFTESVDLAGRLQAQIQDAESNGQLWRFRTVLDDIIYQDNVCPGANPVLCSTLYHVGECWRGILGGRNCTRYVALRENPLDITCVSSRSRSNYWEGEIVTATSALEVGVDDDRIQTTFHYRPPRTVFNFIQRRGRAGRRIGDITYTLMVLGNTPADQFYFFRRNRLLVAGNYELPLNPQNEVIRQMHETLEHQRQQMQEFTDQRGKRNGVLAWVLDMLRRCPVIERYYGSDITAVQRQDYWNQRRWFLQWIIDQANRFNSYLNMKWALYEIEDASPDQLIGAIDAVRLLINEYLEGQQAHESAIQQQLQEIYNEIGRLIFQEQDAETIGSLRGLQDRLLSVWQSLRGQVQFGIGLQLAEGLYDFFRTLGKFNDPDKQNWILNYAPDVLKTVLQAFFYLGLATRDLPSHQNCPSCLSYFIPDAYFQQVKPLIAEVRTSRPAEQPWLEQESVTDLVSLFLPYKVVYRYHPHPYLSTVETEHNPDWVSRQGDQTIVRLRLRGEGLRHDGDFRPQKVYVRAIRGDEAGDQILRLCRVCYSLYSENRQRPCHGQSLTPVRVYATPIVEREAQSSRAQAISRTMTFLKEMHGDTRVLGSDVTVHIMRWTNNGYLFTPNRLAFQALYWEPVVYSLATKGISWRLGEVIECVLQNGELRQQVEALRKTFDRSLVLHTAAHMLYKAIAALSGVNEEVLEYAMNEDESTVLVWERYEGGAGISEIVRDTLRSNPVDVYRELLASAICPVNLAEEDWWHDPQELLAHLAEEWLLPTDDELLSSVAQEAEAERQAMRQRAEEETRPMCRANDGCPVCIHVTYCTARRDERVQAVSHSVAEAILRCLIRRVNRDELEHLMNENLTRGIIPPATLFADPTAGEFNVLLL
jgi:hypothetical protein